MRGIKKHGMWNTRIYRTYAGMKQRCNNPHESSYPLYGGRGIRVCEEWLGENGFVNFYKWAMENGYNDDLTIDRIDGDGDYEPNNCRWVDRVVQNNNTRRNKLITWNGETHTAAEWAKILPIGISYVTLVSRINNGWSVDRAFTEPNNGTANKGHQITINGETHNKKEWCEITGITLSTFERRIQGGWDIEEALTTPSLKERRLREGLTYMPKFCIKDSETQKIIKYETEKFVLKSNGELFDLETMSVVPKEGKYIILFTNNDFMRW